MVSAATLANEKARRRHVVNSQRDDNSEEMEQSNQYIDFQHSNPHQEHDVTKKNGKTYIDWTVR